MYIGIKHNRTKYGMSGCLPSPTTAVTIGVNQLMMQMDNKISSVSIATAAVPIVTLTYRPKVKGQRSSTHLFCLLR